ncbi:TIGR03087 family PEP-CTERM/XrtA system glycosyltransferase [Nitrosococcus wardiae]|uniref:TIGR03087 family PEP-CTERM/XrtA system glycosyltransferase n=1 Tax=Nitrosococcus wardiae TaxID=1814290 RepID=A0A4P7C285_9GAMM|nr:TIGR03087 family PEP-CTERM/XrtA system glycosyltransferase [Nitrosococcus wardiae]
MKQLLFLAHRIPYPPNKGDKIRSFNLLKQLAKDYRVHLGAFVDDVDDWRHVSALQEICQEVYLVNLRPRLRKLRSLSGFITREPLSLPYYRDARMQAWVDQKLRRDKIYQLFVYSSTMAQYVQNKNNNELHRVIDFVDVDSEKWRHYAPHHPWPLSWIYRREGKKLFDYEREVAAEFDATLFVTPEEAALFRRLAPEVAERVTDMGNGVDTDYFSPHRTYPNPYLVGERVLVFTGAMDYWANGDAVSWFVREVFAPIKLQVPCAKFYIVGARPTEAVQRLATVEGVQVTGAVKDIRPYLAHACAAVAPLRVARGLQNKVLEAMAMAKPVLATPAAMEGIRSHSKLMSLVSDDPGVFAQHAIAFLKDEKSSEYGKLGRDMVSRYYNWYEHLKQLENLLERQPQTRRIVSADTQKVINSTAV